MAREKMPEFKRKGNWKNAPGSQAATKKKAPVGMGAKPKAKPAKPAAAEPKIGAGAKPKPKPAMPASSEQKKKPIRARLTDVNSPSRSTKGKVVSKKPQNRSGSTGPEPKKNWGMTRAMSKNSVTRMRKPLNTGARSSRTSGTGYKEGSFMDRMTRAVRRNVYGKK